MATEETVLGHAPIPKGLRPPAQQHIKVARNELPRDNLPKKKSPLVSFASNLLLSAVMPKRDQTGKGDSGRRGASLLSDHVCAEIARTLGTTRRELQIVQSVFDNLPKAGIAGRLHRSEHTVHTLLNCRFEKREPFTKDQRLPFAAKPKPSKKQLNYAPIQMSILPKRSPASHREGNELDTFRHPFAALPSAVLASVCVHAKGKAQMLGLWHNPWV
jgi:hypothetical protein